MADADAGLEETIGRGIVHIGVAHLGEGLIIVCIGPGEILIQGQGLFHVRIVVLQDPVEDVLDHSSKRFDPGGGLIHGHPVGEAGHAVSDGVLPVPGVVDELGQHRETPLGELAHDPVIGVLIRAGEGVLAGHDRVHQVVPGLAHGLAEDLLQIDGADLGLENIVAPGLVRGVRGIDDVPALEILRRAPCGVCLRRGPLQTADDRPLLQQGPGAFVHPQGVGVAVPIEGHGHGRSGGVDGAENDALGGGGDSPFLQRREPVHAD